LNWNFFSILIKRMAALSFIVLIILLNLRFGSTVYGGTQPSWLESLLPTVLMASVLIGVVFLGTLVLGRFFHQERLGDNILQDHDNDKGSD